MLGSTKISINTKTVNKLKESCVPVDGQFRPDNLNEQYFFRQGQLDMLQRLETILLNPSNHDAVHLDDLLPK